MSTCHKINNQFTTIKKDLRYPKRKYTPLFTSELLNNVDRETWFYDLPNSRKKVKLNVTKLSTRYIT
jgi:hypothetical protein